MIRIDGIPRRVFQSYGILGERKFATYVTSESPEHAMSSVRKMNAYKRKLMSPRYSPKTPKERKDMFFLLSRTQFCAAIGL